MREGSFSGAGAGVVDAASADFGEKELNIGENEPDIGKEAYSVEKEPRVNEPRENEPRENEPVRKAVSVKKLLRYREKLLAVKEPLSYSYSCS